MKKSILLFLILLCLSFSLISITSVSAANTFLEGVYKAVDFNFSPENLYTVQNISPSDTAYVLIFDENKLQLQSIRLVPNSLKYNLVPLEPDYRIIIIGKGNVYIN